MEEIIASTYQIEKEIGSGGGGVVYLANHLRLNKKVVLKADKRTIVKTKPEVLRQEVDVLKHLSHTYIPQVYDFFVEDGIVYTVMDYIEGESFDKPLKRGERFSQVQVISWACQLLEALVYLHTRPPYGILHGDIKPANIMLTASGDICLIDFNIALALGEEGAVKVGYSRGYASPEHYTAMGQSISEETELLTTETIPLVDDVNATVILPQNQMKVPILSSKTGSKGGQLLDVRSDIYSLGATLYHILTGVKPAAAAENVVPIARDVYSQSICEIIEKAMAPDPALRYQSVEEMLYAFTHLYETDRRTRRYKKTIKLTAMVLSVLFLTGSGMVFTGLKQMEQLKNAYVLAEYAENAVQAGDMRGAVSYALQALPEQGNLFALPYTAQAQKALTDALGVYDLSDGFRPSGIITLPSEPLKVVLSPDGGMAAVFYAYAIAVFDTKTQQQLVEFPVETSALGNMVFVNDTTLIYTGAEGLCAYDVVQKQVLWTGEKASRIAVSGDGSKVVAVYRDDTQAVLYHAADGTVQAKISFNGKKKALPGNDLFVDLEDDLFTLNQDGSLLAVSFADGSLGIFDVQQPTNYFEIYETSEFNKFTGGFSQQYFAFSATNKKSSVFAVIDTENAIQTGGFSSQQPFLVQADETGIYVALENLVVQIDPESGEQQEQAYTSADISAFQKNGEIILTATQDNGYQFFGKQAALISQHTNDYSCDFIHIAGNVAVIGSHDSPVLRMLYLEEHTAQQVFAYAADYPHDEARISADWKTVMLFQYDRFRLYSMDGTILADVQLPNAEQVYDQQYRRVGSDSWLEVFYYDGTVQTYSAKDGSLLSEKKAEKPDNSLTEEFLTEQFRVVAPLHDTPIVYDRQSGAEVCRLEQDAYLTYVTQVDEYFITEYILTNGQRYGLLLNKDWETLAYLPNLCDILGEELIFDYRSGSLRRSEIYSLEELTARAKF